MYTTHPLHIDVIFALDIVRLMKDPSTAYEMKLPNAEEKNCSRVGPKRYKSCSNRKRGIFVALGEVSSISQ